MSKSSRLRRRQERRVRLTRHADGQFMRPATVFSNEQQAKPASLFKRAAALLVSCSIAVLAACSSVPNYPLSKIGQAQAGSASGQEAGKNKAKLYKVPSVSPLSTEGEQEAVQKAPVIEPAPQSPTEQAPSQQTEQVAAPTEQGSAGEQQRQPKGMKQKGLRPTQAKVQEKAAPADQPLEAVPFEPDDNFARSVIVADKNGYQIVKPEVFRSLTREMKRYAYKALSSDDYGATIKFVDLVTERQYRQKDYEGVLRILRPVLKDAGDRGHFEGDGPKEYRSTLYSLIKRCSKAVRTKNVAVAQAIDDEFKKWKKFEVRTGKKKKAKIKRAPDASPQQHSQRPVEPQRAFLGGGWYKLNLG